MAKFDINSFLDKLSLSFAFSDSNLKLNSLKPKRLSLMFKYVLTTLTSLNKGPVFALILSLYNVTKLFQIVQKYVNHISLSGYPWQVPSRMNAY